MSGPDKFETTLGIQRTMGFRQLSFKIMNYICWFIGI